MASQSFSRSDVDEDPAQLVFSGLGELQNVIVYNGDTTNAAWLKFFEGSAAPTVASATPKFSIRIAAGEQRQYSLYCMMRGCYVAATREFAAGATAASTDLEVNLTYDPDKR